jgi:hypothetical protein
MKHRERSFERALNYILHVPDSRLTIMYAGGGRKYFALPKFGLVAEKDALAIIGHPEIVVFEDGLFPGIPLSWRRRR